VNSRKETEEKGGEIATLKEGTLSCEAPRQAKQWGKGGTGTVQGLVATVSFTKGRYTKRNKPRKTSGRRKTPDLPPGLHKNSLEK